MEEVQAVELVALVMEPLHKMEVMQLVIQEVLVDME